MERTENLIMQEDRWKPLKEMNLTDDFLFDVATTELENVQDNYRIIYWFAIKKPQVERRSEVIHNIPGKAWNPNGFCRRI
ncbi:MAG: hypothetical protein ACLSGB_09455 [Dorea sp.]